MSFCVSKYLDISIPFIIEIPGVEIRGGPRGGQIKFFLFSNIHIHNNICINIYVFVHAYICNVNTHTNCIKIPLDLKLS
jgi:hypothetical protein